MTENTDIVNISALDGTLLKVVSDFKYLGGWMSSTERDINSRKANAWRALHNLKKIWRLDMNCCLKRKLFVATVESVLLYGSESWTMTTKLDTAIDGCYTRMLRIALNVSWKDHMTNDALYGSLPKVSTKIRERRLQLAGHCVRHQELTASQLILWDPKHGKSSRGRRKQTYIDCLKSDTGFTNIDDIKNCMLNRDVWRSVVKQARDVANTTST